MTVVNPKSISGLTVSLWRDTVNTWYTFWIYYCHLGSLSPLLFYYLDYNVVAINGQSSTNGDWPCHHATETGSDVMSACQFTIIYDHSITYV